MVSVGVMTLDLGWPGMQSKFWVGVLSFAGLALVSLARDEGVEATTNKTDIAQVAPASGGTAVVNEGETSAAEATSEGSADVAKDSIDDARPEAANVPIEAATSSASTDNTYTPTERISEDRSVSFPVDI